MRGEELEESAESSIGNESKLIIGFDWKGDISFDSAGGERISLGLLISDDSEPSWESRVADVASCAKNEGSTESWG